MAFNDIPEATEAQVIKAMAHTGCPFAFAIDYFNDLGPLNGLTRKEEVFMSVALDWLSYQNAHIYYFNGAPGLHVSDKTVTR